MGDCTTVKNPIMKAKDGMLVDAQAVSVKTGNLLIWGSKAGQEFQTLKREDKPVWDYLLNKKEPEFEITQ